MESFDLIFITTHQNNQFLPNLIKSIDNHITDLKLLLVVISQECDFKYETKKDFFKIAFIDEKKMGLSKARNIGLNYIKEKNITAEYIMFPDDDSSFDKNFSTEFKKILGSEKSYITPIYNNNSKKLYFGKPYETGKIVGVQKYYLVGSPNQIIQYNKYKEFIHFNENLGVGAKYGSSEDLDLFIKLNLNGIKYYYINEIFSYHPQKTDIFINKKLDDIINRFKTYSSGFAVIIFKYKLYSFIPSYLTRTFVAFVYYGLKLKFKLSYAYFIQLIFRIKLLFTFSFKKVV